ncbi:Uncharacterized protein HZ326_28746 [Fusarium oxysporum f. sp. albedinis]|nr:Uncharacterized protein HZ326_28746 [Fusarium oxysporum f. sp. albedinis]
MFEAASAVYHHQSHKLYYYFKLNSVYNFPSEGLHKDFLRLRSVHPQKPASDPYPSCLATGSSHLGILAMIRALAHAAKFGVALLIGQEPRINPLMRA